MRIVVYDRCAANVLLFMGSRNCLRFVDKRAGLPKSVPLGEHGCGADWCPLLAIVEDILEIAFVLTCIGPTSLYSHACHKQAKSHHSRPSAYIR